MDELSKGEEMFTSRRERDKGQLHLSCGHMYGLRSHMCLWMEIQYQSNKTFKWGCGTRGQRRKALQTALSSWVAFPKVLVAQAEDAEGF